MANDYMIQIDVDMIPPQEMKRIESRTPNSKGRERIHEMNNKSRT